METQGIWDGALLSQSILIKVRHKSINYGEAELDKKRSPRKLP